MTRWDDIITKFCHNDNVFCSFCPDNIKMVFDEKMGYYRCGGCCQIRAPNLIGNDRKSVPLWWTMCRDCRTNNLTEKDQEPYWIVRDENTGKVNVIENNNQTKVTCSNCCKTFFKIDPRKEQVSDT